MTSQLRPALTLFLLLTVLTGIFYPLAVTAAAQAVFPFQANGKALGLGDYAGWVKLVVDEKYGEILGAHMIGPEVTELLPELTLAHLMELTPHEVARNVHAHPTLSEVLMEAAHAAEGAPIHI